MARRKPVPAPEPLHDDDALPEHLRHWLNFLERVQPSPEDAAQADQQMRTNPHDSRELALVAARQMRAFTEHRAELRAWCAARDLLDANGRPQWARIRPPVDALTRSNVVAARTGEGPI